MIRDKSDKKKQAKLPKGVIAVAPPSFRRERALIKRGVWPVAGCDEAGRGPLAGPVVAAAVVLDPKRIPKGIDDSKRLTAERREELFEEICATASFAVAFASPARIDRDNILRASLWALARAVQALPEMPKHVFVDGRDRIDAPCDCDAVIGGDGIVMSIAAASIIAKVTRDRLMCALAQDCPGYGFETHKGYAVPEHREALDRLGPSIHHRRFFAPVVAAREKHEPGTIVEPDLFAVETQIDRRKSFGRPSEAGCLGGSRALSNVREQGRLTDRRRAFRTFHAFHLPGCRTDPRPAAAGGLARGAAAGGAVADPADAALSQPARRSRHRAGVRPGISGRHRSRAAAGVLARRHRVPRRRQPRVRRLSAGADLRGRDVLEPSISSRAPSSAASRRCSRCCSR